MNDDDDELIAKRLQQKEDKEEKARRKRQDKMALRDEILAQRLAADEESQSRSKLPRLSKKAVLDSLLYFQLEAVKYVQAKAKTMHDVAFLQVEQRVKALGFTGQDFKQCLEYIRDDAPIVIHLKEFTLSCLVKDTHYRNLFETNTSGGKNCKESRQKWESDMFGEWYEKTRVDCKPFDRPKYGCLNISGDIEGVKPARAYGTLFLILHQHVRHRATFFSRDTGAFRSGAFSSLATNEYYAHVLNGYSDDDLKTALQTCKSARIGGCRSHCRTYKEVQIHGPLCLATDVQALSVPGRERTASKALKNTVMAFQKQAQCNILWQEDLLHPET